ncbi:MAG: 6-phosphogluconolactonase [Anaerolineales bacterium]|nr:6-phosphogluconolactonase [Anaerolineales bacterium]
MAIIQTLPDPAALAEAAAHYFVACARESIAEHGRFTVALAGGSTPQALYAQLATIEFASQVSWEKVHIFWGDERCVAASHDDSNFRMASETLLKHAPIPEGQVHRLPGELDPKEAAQSYESLLQTFFTPQQARFDLIWLGLGSDGHTASLFPGSKALEEKQRWVVANYVRKLSAWRLTMTIPLINQAARVAFLVSGPEKAAVLRRALAGRYAPEEIPAQLVRPERGQLRWFVDRAAAEFI